MNYKRINPDLYEILMRINPQPDMQQLEFQPEKFRTEQRVLVLNHLPKVTENVTIKNVFITHENNAQLRLRLYIPKKQKSDAVLLYFHGGGYVFGLPEQVEKQMLRIVSDTGFPIVSVDYRLAPEHPFPAALQDAYAALQWLNNEGVKMLSVDPKKVIVSGGSAGGNLAAALTQFSRDRNGPHICFQLLLYPVIHNKLNTASMLEFTDSPFWNTSFARICWTHFLGPDQLNESIKYADLLHANQLNNLPPAAIIVCELDPLRDEGIAYAQQLMQHQIPVSLISIPGATHIFDIFDYPLAERFYQYQIGLLQSVASRTVFYI